MRSGSCTKYDRREKRRRRTILTGAATGCQSGRGARFFRNKTFSGIRKKSKEKESKFKKEGTKLKKRNKTQKKGTKLMKKCTKLTKLQA